MTEQPDKQPEQPVSTPAPAPQKLLIDDNCNFQFHAAYLVYSDIFDHATSDDIKREMNQHIEALKKNEVDFETFYRNVAHHRKLDTPRQERFSLQTQRKKDWRIKEQRSDRIRRHKK
jgi:hypothetical protein